MSEIGQWQQTNDAYLAAAMEWLRLRLSRAARDAPILPAAVPERRSWFGRRQSDPGVPPAPARASDREVRKAAEALQAAEAAVQPRPALPLISDRLGLSPFERDLLLLCAGMELDTRLADLCMRASGRPHPTFALGMTIFDNPAWDVLSPERPLRYWRVLEISQPGAQPLMTSPLRADERIVNALKGMHYLDDRLSPLLFPINGTADVVPPSQRVIVDTAVNWIKRQTRPRSWPVFQLVGTDASSARTVARTVAATLGVPLYRLPVETIPSQTADLETLARLWQRECLLAPLALYLEAHDVDNKGAVQQTLTRFLTRIDGIVMLGTAEVWPDVGDGMVKIGRAHV